MLVKVKYIGSPADSIMMKENSRKMLFDIFWGRSLKKGYIGTNVCDWLRLKIIRKKKIYEIFWILFKEWIYFYQRVEVIIEYYEYYLYF